MPAYQATARGGLLRPSAPIGVSRMPCAVRHDVNWLRWADNKPARRESVGLHFVPSDWRPVGWPGGRPRQPDLIPAKPQYRYRQATFCWGWWGRAARMLPRGCQRREKPQRGDFKLPVPAISAGGPSPVPSRPPDWLIRRTPGGGGCLRGLEPTTASGRLCLACLVEA